MNSDCLKPGNTNKAKCKTCIFGDNPVEISEKRKDEIISYLAKFEYSHVCHQTDKTCYGAMQLQARFLYMTGVIDEPTVEAFLDKAKKILKL